MRRYKILGRIIWFIFKRTPITWALMRFWPPRAYVKIEYKGKILLVQNWLGSGKWSFPGGGVHRGEDAKVGACREVFEETHITLNPESLKFLTRGIVKYVFGGKKFVVYEASLSAKPKIAIDSELNGYVWADITETGKYSLTTVVKEALVKS